MKHVRFYRAGTWPAVGEQPVFKVEAGGVHAVTDSFADELVKAGKGELCAAIPVDDRVEAIATYDSTVGPVEQPEVGPTYDGEQFITVTNVEAKPRKRRGRGKR